MSAIRRDNQFERCADERPQSSSRAHCRLLHDLDLRLGQAVQLTDQPVDLARWSSMRRDLPLQGRLGVGGFGGGEILVQGQHFGDEFDHTVRKSLVDLVFEIGSFSRHALPPCLRAVSAPLLRSAAVLLAGFR